MVYYNENDPNAVAWLRQLITDGLIADGHVDDRSIADVQPNDLDGYTQHHFFAGIGGWSLALRLADVSDDEPVWTGSVPCQPLSGSGEQRGELDERHLWPEFFRLIRERGPSCIYGEQVAGGDGYEWIDGIALDLESRGYAVAAFDIPAQAVGADHERKRLWWVADAAGERQSESWQRGQNAGHYSADEFREADRIVDAFRRRDLPFLCRSHDGVSVGVARCAGKGFGNAIVPQCAAAFIQAHRLARANSGLTELILS